LDARVVNHFIDGAKTVLSNFKMTDFTIGKVSVNEDYCPEEEVNIILGVVGQMQGQIVYGMARDTSLQIVSKMMGGAVVTQLDDLSLSAISELSNMISGQAAAGISQAGVEINITPPLIITGQKIEVHTLKIKSLNIPITTSVGNLIINVALEYNILK